jgi:hypothetical protein
MTGGRSPLQDYLSLSWLHSSCTALPRTSSGVRPGNESRCEQSGFLRIHRMAPGLRELIALSLLAGLGFGLALARGDLFFLAVFGGLLRRANLQSRFVFNTERGGPVTRAWFLKMVRRTGELAKLPFPIHPHRLLLRASANRLSACGLGLRHWLGRTPLLAAELDPSERACHVARRPCRMAGARFTVARARGRAHQRAWSEAERQT